MNPRRHTDNNGEDFTSMRSNGFIGTGKAFWTVLSVVILLVGAWGVDMTNRIHRGEEGRIAILERIARTETNQLIILRRLDAIDSKIDKLFSVTTKGFQDAPN